MRLRGLLGAGTVGQRLPDALQWSQARKQQLGQGLRSSAAPATIPSNPICNRSQLFGRLISQPVAFFDATETAQLTSRLAADCSVISRLFSTSINVAIRNSLQVVSLPGAAPPAAAAASKLPLRVVHFSVHFQLV